MHVGWQQTLGLGVLLLLAPVAYGQRIHRQTFEQDATVLKIGLTDSQLRLLEHGSVTDTRHSGDRSERMVVRVTSGTFLHVEYPVPPSLVFDELAISSWVNSTRPGTRFIARVVLPNVIDESTGKPTTTLLQGDVCEVSNRWRRLEIRRPDIMLQKQQQLLQAERKESVDIRGAYVDALIFDIHSGLGDVAVHFDDIQMGPMVAPPTAPTPVASKENEPKSIPLPLRREDGQMPRVQEVKVRDARDKNRARVVGDQLQIGKRAFFLRGIYQDKAPVNFLRTAGFNTIFSTWPYQGEATAQIKENGLQMVSVLTDSPVRAASAEIDSPRGLAIHLGKSLGLGDLPRVEASLDAIRSTDPDHRRPVTGEVQEAFARYSLKLDMIGASRSPLASSLTLANYRQWLSQRMDMARPGTMFWTQVPTEMPEDYLRVVYGQSYDKPFQVPVGPQPDQIRMMTYASLAAGYRGVVYSSDSSLAESARGRSRLLQLALLNLELTLIEPFLVEGKPPVLARTSHPNVMAVVFQHKHGVLVMPLWTDATSQYLVGQSSVSELQVTLSEAAESAQAYEIGLTEVRGLTRKSDIAGFRITLPEFDTVAFVLMTTDMALIARYQELIQQIAPDAAAWYQELAEIELGVTEQINARLESRGLPYPEAARLLIEAREHLDHCRENRRSNSNRLAIAEAARCLRVSRALQRGRWQQAIEKFGTPASNPFALSYYTLPEAYEFHQGVEQARFGDNQVPSGDFERNGNLDAIGWRYRSHSSQNLHTSALLVGGNPQQGDRSLQLHVESENPVAVVENTGVEMVSPPVTVRTGQVVRISGFVRLPQGAHGSVDGAMVWDSIGGKSMALRFTKPGGWTPFVVHRPVTQSGEVRVHLGMTGIGDAQFDDLKVQVADNAVVPLAGASTPALVR